MGTSDHNRKTDSYFIDRVGIELKRAERYRIFVSVLILDVGAVAQTTSSKAPSVMDDLVGIIRKHIRAIDNISVLDPYRVAVLLPETARQGAEIASRRITELIRNNLSDDNGRRFDQVIPLEMASYPDAAGAMSINDFLREYSEKNLN
jgi:GGDEF domain-containing protein